MAKKTVSKKIIKKPTVSSKQTKYDCDDVEEYLDKAIDRVKGEILPIVNIIDKRDKDQYDAAKKILTDMDGVLGARTENVEKAVNVVRNELQEIYESRKEMTSLLVDSMKGITNKLDNHIVDETNTFKEIQASLKDISEHGTKLARDIDNKLNDIQVNGGTYPLNEALKHIYGQHVQTHNKLNEVITLVEPIQARRRWALASRELIKKNGFLRFIFTTKIGVVIGTVALLLILNTIIVTVFHADFDLISIFKWFGRVLSAAS